jgi:hypothetical protein
LSEPIWGIWEWSDADEGNPEYDTEDDPFLVCVLSGLTAADAEAIVAGRSPWPDDEDEEDDEDA